LKKAIMIISHGLGILSVMEIIILELDSTHYIDHHININNLYQL